MSDAGVKLGGPDNVSIRFLRSFPEGFYLSPRVNNADADLQQFIVDQYFTNGAALFGRESPEEVQALRRVVRGGFDGQNDRQVMLVVEHLVMCVRNYTHLESLEEIEIAEATVDTGMCPFGYLHGRQTVDVGNAVEQIDTLRKLSHQDYGQYAFGQPTSFPPFFVGCLCSVDGRIPGTQP